MNICECVLQFILLLGTTESIYAVQRNIHPFALRSALHIQMVSPFCSIIGRLAFRTLSLTDFTRTSQVEPPQPTAVIRIRTPYVQSVCVCVRARLLFFSQIGVCIVRFYFLLHILYTETSFSVRYSVRTVSLKWHRSVSAMPVLWTGSISLKR